MSCWHLKTHIHIVFFQKSHWKNYFGKNVIPHEILGTYFHTFKIIYSLLNLLYIVIFISDFQIFFLTWRRRHTEFITKPQASKRHWSLRPQIKFSYYIKFPKALTKNKATERGITKCVWVAGLRSYKRWSNQKVYTKKWLCTKHFMYII